MQLIKVLEVITRVMLYMLELLKNSMLKVQLLSLMMKIAKKNKKIKGDSLN